jgi:Sec-independent protein translocase protein TatA
MEIANHRPPCARPETAARGLGKGMREFKSGVAGITGEPEKPAKTESKAD